MATLTTNISNVSLTVSGNTTQSATISWSLPSVPSGATITSCTLTGKATASMSKGSATIKVNGTTVSSGSNFTINLGTGNTTSSVTATAVGGNKNASGTVTISNLVYTVEYSVPLPKYTVTFVDWDGTVLKTQTVEDGASADAPIVPNRFGYVFTGWDVNFASVKSNLIVTAQYIVVSVLMTKESGKWINIPKIYKKISGIWTEQVNDNWYSLFPPNIAYIKKEIPPTAILYSDGSLVFSNNFFVDESHGDIVNTFTGWHENTYSSYSDVPWYSFKDNITNVYINEISPKSTAYWFYNCTKLQNINFNRFNTSNVTDMRYMFYYCRALTSLDVSGFNTSNVTDMISMFSNCSTLTSLDVSGFDTSKVTNMSSMFNKCSTLTSLDVNGFNTSNVTDMGYMFNNCFVLTSLDVSGFDTSKVTSMVDMFNGCSALTSLDVSEFDTSNVTYMRRMFGACSTLTSLDVSGFNTSKVTSMGNMFYNCLSLTSLDVSGFDTSNVADMGYMFYNCSSLTSIDINGFNTSKVTNMGYIFYGCSNPNLKIYVSTEAMATWIKSTSNFPSTATVVVGKPN